jgi:hypothetical protein
MLTGRVPFMAEDSADVMRKHLREKLVPPDHINTALSAGISEVVEVMMAKRREKRYKNIEELLIDLEALQNGQAPIQAHKRFDVSLFEELEKGEVVEVKGKAYEEDTIANYRMAILILSTIAAIFFVVIVLLLLKGR